MERTSTDKSERKSRAGWSEVMAVILWPRPGLDGEEQKLWGQVRWAGFWGHLLLEPRLWWKENSCRYQVKANTSEWRGWSPFVKRVIN